MTTSLDQPAPSGTRRFGPWRSSRHHQSRRRSRYARRIALTCILLALVGALAFIVIAPFHEQRTVFSGHFATGSSDPSNRLLFTSADADEFLALANELGKGDVRSTLLRREAVDALERHNRDIDNAATIVYYLAANTTIVDGEVTLICDQKSRGRSTRETLSVNDVLGRISEGSTPLKFVILDAGRSDHDVAHAVLSSDVAANIEATINDLNDDSLCVLISHDDGQTSEFSMVKGRSYFGDAVARGLRGEADVDRNGRLTIGELTTFVNRDVAVAVSNASAGRFQQTPRLITLHDDATTRDRELLRIPRSVQRQLQRTADTKPSHEPLDWPTLYDEALQREANGDPSLTSPKSPANDDGTPPANESIDDLRRTLASFVLTGWLKYERDRRTSNVDVSSTSEFNPRDLIAAEQVCRAGTANQIEEITKRLKKQLASRQHVAMASTPSSSDVTPKNRPKFDQLPRCSLAMVARDADLQTPPSLVSDLRNELASLRTAIKNGAFDKWMTERWQRPLENISEFQIAQQLHDANVATAPLLRLAIETRVAGENVAAAPHHQRSWFDNDIRKADTLRLAAERSLIDKTKIWQPEPSVSTASPTNISLASEHERQCYAALLEARDQYRTISTRLDIVRRTRSLQRDVRVYCDWFASTQGTETLAPTFDDLQKYLDAQIKLADLLDACESADWSEFEAVANRALQTQQRLASIVGHDAQRLADSNQLNGDDRLLIERLLNTPLPSVELRTKLLNVAGTSPALHVGELPAAADFTPDYTAHRRQQLAWVQFAQLNLAIGEGSPLHPKLERLRTTLDPFDVAQFVTMASDLGRAIDQRARHLRLRTKDDDLQTARLSHRALARLTQFAPRLERVGNENVRRTNDLLDLAETWTSQTLRLASSSVGATNEERSELLVDNNFCNRRVQSIFPATPRSELPPQPVLLSGDDVVELIHDSKKTFSLEVENLADTPEPAWVVMEHDEEVLEVDRVGSEQDSADDPAPLAADDFSDRTQGQLYTILGPAWHKRLQKLPRVEDFDESPVQRPQYVVQRVVKRHRPSPVVAYLVTPTSVTRHVVQATLPSPKVVDLQVRAATQLFTTGDATTTLHPLPNQPTPYTLALVGRDTTTKSVDVQIYGTPGDVQIPFGTVPIEAGARVVSQLGEPVVSLMKVPVKFDQATFLPFTKTKAKPKEGQVPSLAELSNGFVLVTTDSENDRQTFEAVEIATARPRRYLAAPQLHYKAPSRLLTIHIEPQDKTAVPKAGFRVAVTLPKVAHKPKKSKLAGIVKGPQFAADLYVTLPKFVDDEQLVYLHIDDYPRAFVYRIAASQKTGPIHEDAERMAIRIPRDDVLSTAFNDDVDVVPVRLEIDAPVGSFTTSRDRVTIGIDVNRDRRLSGDPQIALANDRQVTTYLIATGPAGLFTVQSHVSDWSTTLPSGGVANTQSDVRATLTIGSQQQDAEPLPITFDSLPPVIETIDLTSGNELGVGQPLTATIVADDENLSGVDRVEAVIALDGVTLFDEEMKPTAAKYDEGRGWSLVVPTKLLDVGSYTLLVRAVDRAGNVSQPEQLPIRIVPPPGNGGPFNVVQGVVRFGAKPVVGATITLSVGKEESKIKPAKTDANGKFTFPKVPVGNWGVSAKGVVFGTERSGEAKVEVKPPPARVKPVVIGVKL